MDTWACIEKLWGFSLCRCYEFKSFEVKLRVRRG